MAPAGYSSEFQSKFYQPTLDPPLACSSAIPVDRSLLFCVGNNGRKGCAWNAKVHGLEDPGFSYIYNSVDPGGCSIPKQN